jgi:hypothetical protein
MDTQRPIRRVDRILWQDQVSCCISSRTVILKKWMFLNDNRVFKSLGIGPGRDLMTELELIKSSRNLRVIHHLHSTRKPPHA